MAKKPSNDIMAELRGIDAPAVDLDEITGSKPNDIMDELRDIDAPAVDLQELEDINAPLADLAELPELTRALTAHVPGVRARVFGATQADTHTQGTEADMQRKSTPDALAKLKTFQEVVESDADWDNAFHSLSMVISLLRHGHKPGETVIADMGFDQDNLNKLMRAVFSVAREEVIPQRKIVSSLSQKGRPTIAVFYYDILGLDKNSTKDDMKKKVIEFEKKIEGLDNLLEYPSHGSVTKALKYRKEIVGQIEKRKDLTVEEKLDLIKEKKLEILRKFGFTGVAETFDADDVLQEMVERIEKRKDLTVEERLDLIREKKIEIVRKFGFTGVAETFDEDVIQEMLDEVEAKVAAGGDPIDYPTFWLANEKNIRVFALLELIYEAFQAFKNNPDDFRDNYQEYFKGHDLQTVVETLNEIFVDVPVGMGLQLRQAGVDGEHATSLVEKIVNVYGINDSETLKTKLEEVHRIIGFTYPNLLEADDPLKMEAEEAARPFINYDNFYRELWDRDTPETQSIFKVLLNLYLALKRMGMKSESKTYETRFEEKEAEKQVFNGQSQATVMAVFNGVLGSDMVLKLQTAAQDNEDKMIKGSLMVAVIADKFRESGLTKNSEALEAKLKEDCDALIGIYKNISTI